MFQYVNFSVHFLKQRRGSARVMLLVLRGVLEGLLALAALVGSQSVTIGTELPYFVRQPEHSEVYV